MSDGPITRPGEVSRIASSDYEFRVFMINSMADLKATLRSHQDEDNRRFDDISERLITVSSAVGQGKETLSKWDGVKSGIAIASTFFLGVGALVGWLLHTLSAK